MLDITKADGVRRILDEHQPTAVINAAAQANVDRADKEPERTRRVNADAPGVLAHCCRERGIRLVHLSTDYVLDAPHLARLTEELPPKPRSVYAETKLAGEQAVLAEGGTVLRIQWVYSPFGHGFFNRALEAMARGQSVRLVTDQVGCPTPAELLAPALLKVATSEASGLFHLATSGEATAFDWIVAGARAAGIEPLTEPAVRADFAGAHRPARSVLDSTKAAQTFGVSLPDWREALRTVVAGSGTLGRGVEL